MELRQLAYFIAVAEELHFTRAAERLRIAQPAVSREQIRPLEAELGERLFLRDRRSVTLTAAGAALLPHARAALVRGRARQGVDRRAARARDRPARDRPRPPAARPAHRGRDRCVRAPAPGDNVVASGGGDGRAARRACGRRAGLRVHRARPGCRAAAGARVGGGGARARGAGGAPRARAGCARHGGVRGAARRAVRHAHPGRPRSATSSRPPAPRPGSRRGSRPRPATSRSW